MTLSRLKATVKRRRRGTVAMIAIAAMIPLTTMFAANINTGQMIEQRRVAQDAADALAKTHGAWTARSLNVLSMNRVTSMQLLSVAAGSEALEGTLQEIEFHALLVAAQITIHAASHCWRNPVDTVTWTPVCAGWHALVGVPALKAVLGTSFVADAVPGLKELEDFDPQDLSEEEQEALEEAGLDDLDSLGIPTGILSGKPQGVWDVRKAYDPMHGVETAKKALEAIIGMDKAIIEEFPQVMAKISASYLKVHEVDDFHFNDPCNGDGLKTCSKRSTRNGMALPLEEVPPLLNLKKLDPSNGLNLNNLKDTTLERGRYCAAFYTGTSGAGPLNILNTTFKQRGFPNNKGPLTVSGSGQQRSLKKHINRTTNVGRILHDFKRFYRADNFLSHLPRHYTTPGLDKFEQWSNLRGVQQVRTNNSFTRRFDIKMASICSGVTLDSFLPDFLPKIADLPDWVPFKYMINVSVVAPLPPLYKLKDVPTVQVPPWVQPDQMPDPFHILALTQAKKGTRLAGQVFTDTVESHYGYGQVGVYNPDDASLYSQNWQYRLMPATRMDDPRDIARDLRSQARSSFGDLVRSLSGVSDSTWRRVHAH